MIGIAERWWFLPKPSTALPLLADLVVGLSLGEYSIPMTQEFLNEAVAEVTGEDIQMIDWLGFVPLTQRPIELETDEDRGPLLVDWDDLELQRNLALCG